MFALLRECRAVQRLLAEPRELPEPASVRAERELYVVLLAAMESGLVRTMDDALKVSNTPANRSGCAGKSGSSGRSGR